MEWNLTTASSIVSTLSGRTPQTLTGIPDTLDSGCLSCVDRLYIPDRYTPGYAYPLIVWFHDDGEDESDVLHWLPQISSQNYVGLGLRGPLAVADGLPGQRRWSLGPEHMDWAEEQLAIGLINACQHLSLHSERIVAAGIGRGATMALQMMLRRPDLFAAAACLNAEFSPGCVLDRWGQTIGRSVWLGHSDLLAIGPHRSAISAAGLLYTAGINVTIRRYDDDEWPLELCGRDINKWLMPTLCPDTVIV